MALCPTAPERSIIVSISSVPPHCTTVTFHRHHLDLSRQLRCLRALYEHLEKLAQQLLPYFCTLEDMPFEVRGVTVRITGDKVQHCDMPTTKEDNVKDSNVNKSQIQRPLYSAVLKGEHTNKRPATCTNSLYEHVTKKKRDSFEVTNSDVQTIANSPQPMGVRSENTKQLPPQEMPAMGRVCETKSIAGDGNCFFRALSYAISGSENGHMKLRRGIVQHLETHAAEFHNYLRAGRSSIPDHLNSSNMKCSDSYH
ncbi:hypothetical protein ABVT39_015882 [Epinephelus coioides]